MLVPRLWFLNQTVDCRVFQKKSAVDILTSLFSDAGFTDSTLPSAGATRDYTVQFNETDLAFATRLMEEEGCFYFFEHAADGHKLIVANQSTAFKDIAGATLQLRGAADQTLITGWARVVPTVRGKMTLKDYDPTTPDTKLQAEQPTKLGASGASKRDDFRWPANTFQSGTVTDRAKWDMEAAEARAALHEGSSRYGKLVAGSKFKLTSRPATPFDDTYVLRTVSHNANDDTWLTQGGTTSYSNKFTCFPSSVPWRDYIATPRPRMEGIHTALVLGPQHGSKAQIKSQSGEEIHTDKLGRIKVRFYWDWREDASGGQAVWARVVQPWAGNGWGAQFIPRVGTEVAVAFVDGDPDRPIVIGGLYNGRDAPIFAPADKNKSGFRSRSVMKGGSANFSEFTFDDTKGSELVFLHAEKDLTTEVENDQTLKVDNCRIVKIKQDETVEIGNNRSVTIKSGNDTLDVKTGNRSVSVDQGNHALDVKMGNRSVSVGQGNDTLDVKMGNISIKAGTGKIEMQAMQSITLTVGSNSVKIDQMGVTINGMMIKIAGSAMTDIKGPMTKVTGDGMLTLKGGIMMLN